MTVCVCVLFALTILQRKFKLIRELDEKCSGNKATIKECHEGSMAGAHKDSVLQETLHKMRRLHSECVTWGDEKMSLAIQAYDVCDGKQLVSKNKLFETVVKPT